CFYFFVTLITNVLVDCLVNLYNKSKLILIIRYSNRLYCKRTQSNKYLYQYKRGGTQMSITLILFLLIIFIVALAGTFIVLKEEENKMKKHKEDGDTAKENEQRSEESEEEWLKTGLRKQVIIYTLSIILALIIAFVIFIEIHKITELK